MLTVIGLNWDAPADFTVTLTPENGAPIVLNGGAGLAAGGVWSTSVAIDV